MSNVNVLGAIFTFASYAMLAVFVENAVLGRAFGVSRLVKLVNDEESNSLIFCILLGVIQMLASYMAFYANRVWLASSATNSYIRPLIFVLCMVIAFTIVLVAVAAIFPARVSRDALNILPTATFNSCIIGTLLITTTQGFTLSQTLGFALGSTLSYATVVFVLSEGEKRLNEVSIPKSLQGLPINLIYLAILSMAVYGMTGHMLSF